MINEINWRLACFFAALLIMFIWEQFSPEKKLKIDKTKRWFINLSLVLINSLIIRLILPIGTLGAALYAQIHQLGLFNQFNLLHNWLVILIGIILLDLIIYTQHLVFHHWPLLWRLHKIHHIDQELDCTTGLRFHPLEIMLSATIKISAIFLLGIPALAVIIFEILLNASSLFNHANIHLSQKISDLLRILIVTPNMHRIHHSNQVKQTNSNFGFNLSLWDRLFKTYQSPNKNENKNICIGLTQYQNFNQTGFWQLIILPFLKK